MHFDWVRHAQVLARRGSGARTLEVQRTFSREYQTSRWLYLTNVDKSFNRIDSWVECTSKRVFWVVASSLEQDREVFLGIMTVTFPKTVSTENFSEVAFSRIFGAFKTTEKEFIQVESAIFLYNSRRRSSKILCLIGLHELWWLQNIPISW
jgi:hypothetical protein